MQFLADTHTHTHKTHCLNMDFDTINFDPRSLIEMIAINKTPDFNWKEVSINMMMPRDLNVNVLWSHFEKMHEVYWFQNIDYIVPCPHSKYLFLEYHTGVLLPSRYVQNHSIQLISLIG